MSETLNFHNLTSKLPCVGIDFRLKLLNLLHALEKICQQRVEIRWLNMQTTDMVLGVLILQSRLKKKKVLSYKLYKSAHGAQKKGNIQPSHCVSCCASSFTTEDLSCAREAILICLEVEYLLLMAMCLVCPSFTFTTFLAMCAITGSKLSAV